MKRLSAFCKVTLLELPESRLPASPSAAQVEGALEEEGEAILAKLPSSGYVFALCIEGKLLSSEELAQSIAQTASSGSSNITLIIGGSYGLSPGVKQAADCQLSLSRMTFPHQLTRVLLLEQLYRAFSINHNGKYHK